MPSFTPVEKSRGDLIQSADWNDTIREIQRLETAKANKAGDTFTGPLTISGSTGTHTLNFSQNRRQMINLWGTNYGIGIQDWTQYYRTSKNFAWYKLGSHNDAELNAGGGTVQMVIRDGNVGIGTVQPANILHLHGNSSNFGLVFTNEHNTSGKKGYRIAFDNDRLTFQRANDSGNFTENQVAIAQDTGNVGIGTTTPGAKLEVVGTTKTSKLRLADKWLLSGDGDAYTNDEWLRLFNANTATYYGGLAAHKLWSNSGSVEASDLRMKRDIDTLPHSLRNILALQGVRFKWQSEGNAGKDHLGLIAQEVESVFPELVETGPDGMKGIHYQGLMAPLIEAIKQQQLQIAELRTEIQALKAA